MCATVLFHSLFPPLPTGDEQPGGKGDSAGKVGRDARGPLPPLQPPAHLDPFSSFFSPFLFHSGLHAAAF